APGEYAVGIGFFSQDYRQDLIGPQAAVNTETTSGLPQPGSDGAEADTVARIAADEGLRVPVVREAPQDESVLAEIARTTQPRMRQVFFDLDPDHPARDTEDLRRRAYIVRKRLDTEGIYFPSLSPATITYTGMLSTGQLASYFTELSDERLT